MWEHYLPRHWLTWWSMANSIAVAVVLITHAPLGQALYSCVQHVLQGPPDLRVADILPDDLPQPWIARLVAELAEQPSKNVLLCCDLYGSTPYHIATAVQRQLSLRGFNVHLISGVNVCMTLKACTVQAPDLDTLVEMIIAATHRGVVHQSPS